MQGNEKLKKMWVKIVVTELYLNFFNENVFHFQKSESSSQPEFPFKIFFFNNSIVVLRKLCLRICHFPFQKAFVLKRSQEMWKLKALSQAFHNCIIFIRLVIYK